MITVYLDESGQEDREKFMVLGGFWGKKEQWEGLAADWKATLGNRQSLHMKALRWNSKPERTEKLLERLGSLPYKNGLASIYAAVKIGDYQDIVANNAQLEERWAGYSVCLVAVMQRLSITVPSYESIKIVCEEQDKYEESATRTYRQARLALNQRPDRPLFTSIEFIPKDSSILLQPSDFLAYGVAHYLENRNSRKSRFCEPIFGPDGQTNGRTLTRDAIRDIVLKRKATMASVGSKGF
jgi:hypothetical protein